MEDRVAHCHIVAQMLAADARVNDREQAFLDRCMTRMGLSDAERDRVVHFEGIEEAEQVAGQWSEDKRRQLLDELVAAALVDGKLDTLEMKMVERLSDLLGFGESRQGD